MRASVSIKGSVALWLEHLTLGREAEVQIPRLTLLFRLHKHYIRVPQCGKTCCNNKWTSTGLGLGLETLTLKAFSSSCLSPLKTGSHSATPSSMRKELSILGQNSYLYEKRTISSGIEPLSSNLQLSTLPTKPSSHIKESFLTFSHVIRFLDLNISLCLGHFMRERKTFLNFLQK